MRAYENVTSTHYSLADANEFQFKQNGLPVFIYLILMCIIGIPGNLQVLFVYIFRYKKSTYKVFILSLAVVDFVACVFCVPSTLYSVTHYYTVDSTVFCKISRAISFFTGTSSLFLLDVVAFERFRMICQPLKNQITVQKAKRLCLGIFLFVLTASAIPNLVFIGVDERPTPFQNLTGFKCAYEKKFKDHIAFKIYYFIFNLFFVCMIIFCVAMYALVFKKLRQCKVQSNTKRYQNTGLQFSMQHEEKPRNNEDIRIAAITSQSDNDTEFSMIESGPSLTGANTTETNANSTTKVRKRKENGKTRLAKGKKKTIIFFIVSLISFGSYLPFLIGVLVGSFDKSFFKNYPAVYLFFGWGVFLNNAINPVVYGFMDPKFRKECFQLYTTRKCFKPLNH